mgnify:CR=1 FL=1
MHPLPSKLLIGLLLLLPTLTWALPSDRQKPINIEADHAQMDDKIGVTQYKGRAVLTQGTLRIEGDIITFYYDADKQLKKAVAQGKPAKYQQVQTKGEKPVRARGLQMEYYARSQKIYLLGDGHVIQNGDEFKGNRIEYDIAKNVVNASSVPVKIDNKVKKSNERIHIIINPNGTKPSSKPKRPKKTVQNTDASSDPKAASSYSNKEKPTTKFTEQEDGYPVGYTTTGLNVRTGPGTQYSKLTTFPPNSELIILTEQNDWLQVRGQANGEVVIGWVHRDYLSAN